MDGVSRVNRSAEADVKRIDLDDYSGARCGRRPRMPEMLRQIFDLMLARPLTTLGCAIVAILYVQLMAGPRVR